jgi:Flp pilus assembly protein CpaB
MQSRTLPLLIIALLCGLGAAYLAYVYLGGANRNDPDVKVLVPKEEIKNLSRLDNSALFHEKVVKQSSLRTGDEPIRTFEEIQGCRNKDYKLEKDRPFYKSDVVLAHEAGVGARLAEDEVALTVKVSPEDAGGGHIGIGDHVDIICKIPSARSEGGAKFKTTFQNIEVLAVNEKAVTTPDQPSLMPQTLTLRFKRADMTAMVMYRQMGTVNVALRKPGYKEIVALSDVDVGGVYLGSNTGGEDPSGMLTTPGKTEESKAPTEVAVEQTKPAEQPPRPSTPTPVETRPHQPEPTRVAIKPEPKEVDHNTIVVVGSDKKVYSFRVPNPKYLPPEDKDGKIEGEKPKTEGSETSK